MSDTNSDGREVPGPPSPRNLAMNGFSCPTCARVLSRKDKLKDHILKVHGYGKVV